MSDLDLPLVTPTDTASSALLKMRSVGRSAVVMVRGTEYLLFTADELLDVLRDRRNSNNLNNLNVRVSELSPRLVGLSVPSTFGSGQALDRVSPMRGVEAALLSSGASYAVLGEGTLGARVMTRFDRLGDALLETPRMCVCRKDPNHCWRPDDLTDAGRCKMDNSEVDCG